MATGDRLRAGPPAPDDRDPGLQPERTRLAWRRTTLSCTVVTVLAARQLAQSPAPGPGQVAAVALAGVAWLVFGLVAHRRMRAMAAGRPPGLPPRSALLVAGCTIAFAVLGAVLLLTGL
ncbi:DUF202 domain-containing protein [Streptomyces pinistramenti]|uniref:DUF202 domain-containing protein n=1 Tax=Streptomyces pinistramenti TaxID=2884812 RepID=UPI001D087875|nr:DUF202 domain-containing protein [Streptomyces pinistramenti]MCB5909947.1 DUF202 domain-containing protein [Streptomyces pinistramenti]